MMAGVPPKPTRANAENPAPSWVGLASQSDPNDTWNVYCGAVGYWLPHALNQAARWRNLMATIR